MIEGISKLIIYTLSSLLRLPFIAAEVFNCELSKINDLFFTSREESEGGVGQERPPRKEISSSPLPRDEEEDEDNEEEDAEPEEEEEKIEEEEDEAAVVTDIGTL
jgi:hypothetical protein